MISFGAEKLSTLWEEVFPLLVEHYKEVSKYQDIRLDPDISAYTALEEAGALAVYTARKQDGTLLGYAAYIIRVNMHYQSSLQAMQDVIFLTKEARKGMAGYKLIKYADQRLQELGVQIVYHHVKNKLDFGPVLARLGYEPVEQIWARRLDK